MEYIFKVNTLNNSFKVSMYEGSNLIEQTTAGNLSELESTLSNLADKYIKYKLKDKIPLYIGMVLGLLDFDGPFTVKELSAAYGSMLGGSSIRGLRDMGVLVSTADTIRNGRSLRAYNISDKAIAKALKYKVHPDYNCIKAEAEERVRSVKGE